jgi:hypothetical protein
MSSDEEKKKDSNDESAQILLTKLREWGAKEYMDMFLPIHYPSEIKEKIDSMDYNYSSYSRRKTYRAFINLIMPDTTNTICTTCRIYEADNIDESVIYAFIYIGTIEEGKEEVILTSEYGYQDLVYKYYTLGPSYESKDGEYRHGFVNFISLKKCSEGDTKDIWDEIEEHVISNVLTKRRLRLKHEHFYPTIEKKQYEESLDYSLHFMRLPEKLLVMAWFNAIFNYVRKLSENNVNPRYMKVLTQNKIKEDVRFFNYLVRKYSAERIERIRIYINNIYGSIHITNSMIRMGQKIIPLNLSEAQDPFNIQYKPWREYFVQARVSDLIVNNIAPCFSVTDVWFYIKNQKKGLFDNKIQYDKIEKSDLAKEVIDQIVRAQAFTYHDIAERKRLKKEKETTTWLSNKFRVLYDKLQDPIDYSREELLMSEVALCIISEYVGHTFVDMIIRHFSSRYYARMLGYPLYSSGYKYFYKFMFEICYGLYCMNYHFGLIHGDLHLNNVSVKSMYYKGIIDISKLDDPHVLYVIPDVHDIPNLFLFPTMAYHSCIIDFSRSIIHPSDLHLFEDPSLPKNINIKYDIDKFQSEQISRMINIYISLIPNFAEKKDELGLLFKNNFDACFRLFTIVDIYGFAQKLLIFLKHFGKKVYRGNIKLLEKITRYSRKFLTMEMSKLLSNPEYENVILAREFPMLSIIKYCFTDYLYPHEKPGTITDLFVVNSPLKYSIRTLQLFPPFISKLRDHKFLKGKIKKETENEFKRIELYQRKKEKNLAMIEYIAQRHKEKYF